MDGRSPGRVLADAVPWMPGGNERLPSHSTESQVPVSIQNQCEITYVNHIGTGPEWQTHGQLGEILTLFSPRGAWLYTHHSIMPSQKCNESIVDDLLAFAYA